MKYIYRSAAMLVMALLFTVCSLQAQITIKGKIIDASSRQPLPGITVVILPGKISGVTDELGNFSLKIEKGAAQSIQTVGAHPR